MPASGADGFAQARAVSGGKHAVFHLRDGGRASGTVAVPRIIAVEPLATRIVRPKIFKTGLPVSTSAAGGEARANCFKATSSTSAICETAAFAPEERRRPMPPWGGVAPVVKIIDTVWKLFSAGIDAAEQAARKIVRKDGEQAIVAWGVGENAGHRAEKVSVADEGGQ